MKKLLETAIQASLEAGAQIMSIYESGDFDINLKKDKSPLTKADIASHEAIMSYLEGTKFRYYRRKEKTSTTRNVEIGPGYGSWIPWMAQKSSLSGMENLRLILL